MFFLIYKIVHYTINYLFLLHKYFAQFFLLVQLIPFKVFINYRYKAVILVSQVTKYVLLLCNLLNTSINVYVG